VGPSGDLLDRTLQRASLSRDNIWVDNIVRCKPPRNELRGADYEVGAATHCMARYLDPDLPDSIKAIVSTGAIPTRHLAGLSIYPKIEHWHGTVLETSRGPVIPTFHPAFMLRGKKKFIGVVVHDLLVAKSVIDGTWKRRDIQTLVDPPVTEFREFVRTALANPDAWLAVDIETPYKSAHDEGELDDVRDDIVRINFSIHPDIGWTVPWSGMYKTLAMELLRGSNPKILWNERYDIPRLKSQGAVIGGKVLDFMLAWHCLQSDLPMSLGFVAPFYSTYGPWKHLNDSKPGEYAALDGAQTLRCALGMAPELDRNGLNKAFFSHIVDMDSRVLHPAEDVGLPIDRENLEEFNTEIEGKRERILEDLRGIVPTELCKEKSWKRQSAAPPEAKEIQRTEPAKHCTTCGAVDISIKHRCKDKKLKPKVIFGDCTVTRWVIREPFNPNSKDDILRYIESKGLKTGKGKSAKTLKPSTDKKAMDKLYAKTKDPFFRRIMEFKAVDKVYSTYVQGTLKRLDLFDRIHPSFLHKPSTMRLSCVNPNVQNVSNREAGAASLDEEFKRGLIDPFRKAIIAGPGNVLVEADFSGIEAVLTGWFSGDPNYIRLARLGVHAYLATYLLGEGADLSLSDADLRRIFGALKKRNPGGVYDRAKRCVHGTNYGLTPHGMVNNYPDDFSLRTARETQAMYFDLCPKLRDFQNNVRLRAAKSKHLGGSDHPFGYIHWFWDINLSDSGTSWVGEDSKRVVAFYPQSSAAGVLTETCLELTNKNSEHYIGDYTNGATPIRALVHDSILAEVPEDKVDDYIEHVTAVMERPQQAFPLEPSWGIGEYLAIGADVKVGKSWGDMV